MTRDILNKYSRSQEKPDTPHTPHPRHACTRALGIKERRATGDVTIHGALAGDSMPLEDATK
jgi:hypothetical protein